MKGLLLVVALGFASCNLPLIDTSEPRPTPTATNVPTSTPTMEPTLAAPTPIGTPPWENACNLSRSSANCVHSIPYENTGAGRNAVLQAMNQVHAKYPYFFEERPEEPWQCKYRLKKAYTNAYYWALILQINENTEGDVCAQWDGDQLNVKYTNAFSESYHPIRFNGGFPPVGCESDKDGIYSYACVPAGF